MKNKKIILSITSVLLLIVMISLVNFFYYQGKIAEIEQETTPPEEEIDPEPTPEDEFTLDDETIQEEKDKCAKETELEDFDPDFEEVWSNDKLANDLVVQKAIKAYLNDNKDLCNYFNDKEFPNEFMTTHNCNAYYEIIEGAEQLNEGKSCGYYSDNRSHYFNADFSGYDKEAAIEIINHTLCQTYQDGEPAVVLPEDLGLDIDYEFEDLCDVEPSDDVDIVEVSDPLTDEEFSCPGQFASEFKFLIGVAEDDSNVCENIKHPEINSLCKAYFDESFIDDHQNDLKKEYCHNLVENYGTQ